MNNIALGQYLPLNSIVHRMDPRAKIAAMLIVMIAAVVLFILELKQRARYRAELIGPYDFHFSAFFNNWASITLLVVLIISMALNVIASLV